MKLNAQQENSLALAEQWFENTDNVDRPFRIFGYAGTGKTTIAKNLKERLRCNAAFVSFTGKAALMLQSKGCSPATTIHKLIYQVRQVGPDGEIEFDVDPDKMTSARSRVDLIVVDEASMVNDQILSDLRNTRLPILAFGDPMQLPPVVGGASLISGEPDVMLTQVMRQAEDSPVLRLATEIRAGKQPAREPITFEMLDEADVVLVGTNSSRQHINDIIRHRRGHHSEEPRHGERLIVLRNNYRVGLMNGEMITVREWSPGGYGCLVEDARGVVRTMDLTFEKDAGQSQVQVDFGYAITVHKSQGSEWDRVLVLDESQAFREASQRWLYTAVTRARKSVVVCSHV